MDPKAQYDRACKNVEIYRQQLAYLDVDLMEGHCTVQNRVEMKKQHKQISNMIETNERIKRDYFRDEGKEPQFGIQVDRKLPAWPKFNFSLLFNSIHGHLNKSNQHTDAYDEAEVSRLISAV